MNRMILGDSREMEEIPNESVHLVVTSPPYPMITMWDECFKKISGSTDPTYMPNYEAMHHELFLVWRQCYWKLVRGGILAINIGDATKKYCGEFQVFPNHAKIMHLCELCAFTTLPYILWKKPNNRPNAFLGSGFLPTNGYVSIDCEYILLFRKGGPRKFEPKDPNRIDSSLTKEERDAYFSQIWSVNGTKQTKKGLERRTGAFPEEIPHRLIKMFSVKGDTVLDPFAGIGTTLAVAEKLGRIGIGYEIDKDMVEYYELNKKKEMI